MRPPVIIDAEPSGTWDSSVVVTQPEPKAEETYRGGLRITDVGVGPGARGGLKNGDLIVAVNDVPTPTVAEFQAALERFGGEVTIAVFNEEQGRLEGARVTPQQGRIGIRCDEVVFQNG
jgi:S1-C subfamily serine protease